MSENAVFHHALVSDGQRLIQCYNNSTPEQRERAVRNLCEEHGTAVRISRILLPMAMFVVDGVIAKNTAQEHGPWSMRRLHTF